MHPSFTRKKGQVLTWEALLLVVYSAHLQLGMGESQVLPFNSPLFLYPINLLCFQALLFYFGLCLEFELFYLELL